MARSQDPFYLVKDEIQELIDKLQASFRLWEKTPFHTVDHARLTKEILASIEGIDWQVNELDKTIAVAAQDLSRYGVDESELERRRRWTGSTRDQVAKMEKAVVDAKGSSSLVGSQYNTHEHVDFHPFESEREKLMIKRQDEERYGRPAGVQRIGDVTLAINDDVGQEINIDDMESDIKTLSRVENFKKRIVAVTTATGPKEYIIALVAIICIIFFLLLFT